MLENLLQTGQHPVRLSSDFSQFVNYPHFLLVISGDQSVAAEVTASVRHGNCGMEDFVLFPAVNRFLPNGRDAIPSRRLFQTFLFVMKSQRQFLGVCYLFQTNRRRPLPGRRTAAIFQRRKCHSEVVVVRLVMIKETGRAVQQRNFKFAFDQEPSEWKTNERAVNEIIFSAGQTLPIGRCGPVTSGGFGSSVDEFRQRRADDPIVLVRRVNGRHFAGLVQQLVVQSVADRTDQFQLVDDAGCKRNETLGILCGNVSGRVALDEFARQRKRPAGVTK